MISKKRERANYEKKIRTRQLAEPKEKYEEVYDLCYQELNNFENIGRDYNDEERHYIATIYSTMAQIVEDDEALKCLDCAISFVPNSASLYYQRADVKKNISDFIKLELEYEGYNVCVKSDGREGFKEAIRYNYDLTGEIVSEYKVQGGVVTALSVINGNVVAGVMTPDDVSKLVILDKDLVLVKDSTIAGKTKFYDFAETRDGFAAVMVNAVEETTEPLEPADPVDPQDPKASLTGRKENDVKAVSVVNFYGIKFYNNNLTEYLPAVELSANVTRIESTVGGLVYCGDTYADDDYADYNLSIAKFGYEE